jgi:hypothetical protein
MRQLFQVLGGILVVVGVLGFVNNPVLGIFEVNALHNIIHIATGAALVYAGMQGGSVMRMIAQVFGVVYALVAVVGFVAPAVLEGLININAADNVLHVVLAVVLLYVGFMGARAMATR